MKKYRILFFATAIAALIMNSCGESKPDLFIGKWDVTNDPTSSLQIKMELKENGAFTETWTFEFDDVEPALVEIQGKYFFEEGERKKVLCRIYDLESLSDPNEILKIADREKYFEEENKEYYDSKKRDEVYGLQGVVATPTRMYYEVQVERGGNTIWVDREWLRINEDDKKSAQ